MSRLRWNQFSNYFNPFILLFLFCYPVSFIWFMVSIKN